MGKEAPLLRYDAEQRVATYEGGFGFLAEMRGPSGYPSKQRAISIWVRDALKKDTEHPKEELRRLNKDVIHGGDVRSDAMVVTERYRKNSTEWQSFRTLYGLTPDNALDRAASILLKNARTNLPTEVMGKQREDPVALLLEERYEEA
ncbi:hypothetical protein N7539_004886 [Penicillium diatomitis]|uniref:Uncharacterized protein n=1 Tax=Penicillium diatomitis TaxID=2819901 RepID=A0A9W9X5W0_9EURO|nr:uncharacterized protein N7539_004886 [Penicillium diatomitis]KAJ5484898.1 hypothetical protein N7539_004886 [Penicillium diatomitis]